MKKFSLSFLMLSFLVANLGFAATAQEKCAIHIANRVFKPELHAEYPEVLTQCFKADALLKAFAAYDVLFERSSESQIEKALQYLDQQDPVLAPFTRGSFINYLSNAYPAHRPHWRNDLEPDVLELMETDASREEKKRPSMPLKPFKSLIAKDLYLL